jgi:nitroreductase
MDVFEAVDSRLSCRAYLDRPVDPEIVRSLISRAARVASSGNLQPWRVYAVSGAALVELKKQVAVLIADGDPRHNPTEYPFQPPDLWEPYRGRREEHGHQLYSALGIERSDTDGRLRQYKRNFELFGAPVALFVTTNRRFGVGQWADVGAYVSTIMHLARGYGLDTCPQQSWCRARDVLVPFLGIPSDQIIFCAISIGYGDRNHPANSFRSHRAELEEFATFVDAVPVADQERERGIDRSRDLEEGEQHARRDL